MQGTCLMPFLNFFFDDMQYINTCIVCRGQNKNGGEIRSMTTSQDNISDIGKHPQVNIKKQKVHSQITSYAKLEDLMDIALEISK